MRIAIISDIHGNRTAFDAVLADVRNVCPDLILHGGDLADSGSDPDGIVDQIRDLGWSGVLGNTDEMLFRPESAAHLNELFPAIGQMASETRGRLGEQRLRWLSGLSRVHSEDGVALVHASPASVWTAPGPDGDLASIYEPLSRSLVVYGHIHKPFVRILPNITVANAGSVSLPYDGDPRASYLLLDGTQAVTRRVDYDIEKEARALKASGLPHADWVVAMLQTGRFQMP